MHYVFDVDVFRRCSPCETAQRKECGVDQDRTCEGDIDLDEMSWKLWIRARWLLAGAVALVSVLFIAGAVYQWLWRER